MYDCHFYFQFFFHRFTTFRYTAGSGYVLVGSGSGVSSTGQVAISSGAASGGIAGAGECDDSYIIGNVD